MTKNPNAHRKYIATFFASLPTPHDQIKPDAKNAPTFQNVQITKIRDQNHTHLFIFFFSNDPSLKIYLTVTFFILQEVSLFCNIFYLMYSHETFVGPSEKQLFCPYVLIIGSNNEQLFLHATEQIEISTIYKQTKNKSPPPKKKETLKKLLINLISFHCIGISKCLHQLRK